MIQAGRGGRRMREFRERVAVVTGGGSGIGAALCRRWAAAGMKVVVADIDLASAERVCTDLEAAGHTAIATRVDVSQAAEVEELASLAYRTYGSVDLLCNTPYMIGFLRAVHDGADYLAVDR